jgi:hypothetical protein
VSMRDADIYAVAVTPAARCCRCCCLHRCSHVLLLHWTAASSAVGCILCRFAALTVGLPAAPILVGYTTAAAEHIWDVRCDASSALCLAALDRLVLHLSQTEGS